MKLLVHKTDPVLALVLSPQEWGTNAHRCQEWMINTQHPMFLAEQGVQSAQAAQTPMGVVILLTFRSQDEIREWILDRREYTEAEFIMICKDLGKDPMSYFQRAQMGAGGFTIQF